MYATYPRVFYELQNRSIVERHRETFLSDTEVARDERRSVLSINA